MSDPGGPTGSPDDPTRSLPGTGGASRATTGVVPVPPHAVPTSFADAPPGYEIRGELGRGGMGVVYEARQIGLNRVVALKMILQANAPRAAVARFWAEAEVVAAVRHPHVVQVFELGEHAGRPFMAMEFAAGGSLADRLRDRPLTPASAAETLEKIARGVAAAHELGIVHRDLKPGNVLLDAAGEPKVADFGLARRRDSDLTQTQAFMGTPAYMAPEQAAGKARFVGPPADVWALGVILYECLAGKRPFEGETAASLLSQIQSAEPAAVRALVSGVPRDLDTIVSKCLAKEPERRYPTAAELADDLGRFRRGEPIAARPIGRAERLFRWGRRHPAAVGFIAATLVAVLSLTGFLVNRSYQQRLADTNARLESALGEADRLRGRVEEQELRTREALHRVERVRYPALIALAGRELAARDLGRAEELLEACPAALRGWEWAYLFARAHVPRTAGRKHTGRVLSLAYSPDGERLAAGAQDGSVRIRDENLFREKVVVIRGHQGPVRAVAISPDGSSLATAGDDGTVRIWELTNKKDAFRQGPGPLYRAGPVFRRPGPVRALAYSPDGSRLASIGGDGGVWLWEVGRKEPRELGRHGGPGRAAAFRPDGSSLATAGEDGLVRVWDRDGREVQKFGPHAGQVSGVAWRRDGKQLAAAVDAPESPGEVVVWDAGTGQAARTLPGPPGGVLGVAYTPDDRLAATGRDGTIRIWAPDGAETILRGTPPTTPPVVRQDGKFLAAGGGNADNAGEVTIWNLAGPSEDRVLRAHVGSVAGIAFGPDGERLATGGADGLVKLWQPSNGREVRTVRGHEGAVSAVAVSPDTLTVASAGRDGTVRLWDVPTGEGRILKGHPGPVTAVAFAPDGSWLASAGAGGEVIVWDANTGVPRLTLKGHTGGALALAVGPDGRRLATAGADRLVRVWDAADGRELLVCRGHAAAAAGVAFSPDGTQIASAGADRTVRVWDTATGKPLHVLAGHSAEVRGVAFSADGNRLASASADGTVKLWDSVAGLEVFSLPASPRGATGVAFDTRRRLAASAADGSVRLWDVPPRANNSAAFDHDD
jgi:WD40 repeat protein